MVQQEKSEFCLLPVQHSIESLKTAAENRISIQGLAGSSMAYWVSEFSKKNTSPLLIFAESFLEAEQLFNELRSFCGDRAGFFPHWDTLPYDIVSPDKEVIAVRMHCLSGMLQGQKNIIVTTPNAVMQRLIPRDEFLANVQYFEQGKEYSREDLISRLMKLGFSRVDVVEEQGEFAVRGDIIDLFNPGDETPIRMDFFDDELEQLRRFQVESQLTFEEIQTIQLLPVHEILFDSLHSTHALQQLRDIKGLMTPADYQTLVDHIRSESVFPGAEQLFPLFFETTSTLFDYFQQTPRVIFNDYSAVSDRAGSFFQEVLREHELSLEQENVTLALEHLFIPEEDFLSLPSLKAGIHLAAHRLDAYAGSADIPFLDNQSLSAMAVEADKQQYKPAWNICRMLANWSQQGSGVVISCRNFSEIERLQQLFQEMDALVTVSEEESFESLFYKASESSSLTLTTQFLNRGFREVSEDGATRFALVSFDEIFGVRKTQRRLKKNSLKQFMASMESLNEGDYVVHVEYGVGKYEGLQKIEVQGTRTDYLVISYQGNDKVYVPVDKFHLVQKFSGLDSAAPRLNKLGDKTWTKTKSRVRAEVHEMAEELVKIYAARKAHKGVSFSSSSPVLTEFEFSFPYQETEDQVKCIEDVYQDMQQELPMDRLVCGDVGFGKTEVAMRAAAKAVIDGFQVGILVPTTILAQQHFENFQARFKDFPVNVEMLSRFRTPAQVKETLKKTAEHKVDIVIGTHRILSKDVQFKKLGLLIIDEEQRFGVKHKEKIKELRSTVDVIALSATPIPRTLHMSMVGIRDISIINTPPMDRRAIRTRLLKFSEYVIKEAVEREMRRKGQVFFIHNRVETIYDIGNYLKSTLPRVRIGVAHGQMSEKDLDAVMHAFVAGEYDILLATTIVESGLDIPNANTIIVNNADQFGLSQLYQLRGRVGRSNKQAYAYLLIPKDKLISTVAKKRLSVLQELNDLGAGFKVASHDLELRGAGNLLGTKQSGHIASVGFDLYTSMVEEEVRRIQEGRDSVQAAAEEIKLNLGISAYIPDSYIISMNQRLEAYKEISEVTTEEDLWNVWSSLENRFGKLPEPASYLFYSMQIRMLSLKLQLVQLDLRAEHVEMKFSADFKPDPQAFFMLLQKENGKMLTESSISLPWKSDKLQDLITRLQHFLAEINEALVLQT